VRVGTVDDYQGQEEKVMFISTVASRGPPTPTTSAKSEFSDVSSDPRLGFLACPRRFNVAVTRAKALNVIVGHPVALERWTHWKALLRHCLARGAYVGEGALAADLGARRGGRSFLPSAPSSTRDEKHTAPYADGHAAGRVGGASAMHEGDGRKMTDDDDDDDEYEALASAIARVAETSLLGGGDADAMFPDFEVGTSFGDHQSWKVAL
jgi:putative helicase MOV10L1